MRWCGFALRPRRLKATARRGHAAVSVHIQARQKHVLRDRKRLLFWLRALMRSDGAVATDNASTMFWSEAMLEDELAHDADLDVESLYTIHAVQASADHTRVAWLHTHGLEELRAFDVDFDELFVDHLLELGRQRARRPLRFRQRRHALAHVGEHDASLADGRDDAFDDLRARYMLPVHFDTFVNSLDEYGEAPRVLRQLLPQRGLDEARVAVLSHGQQRVFLRR